MIADRDPHTWAGARLRLAGGQVHPLPPVAAAAGLLPGRYSVLSPGTERRQLAATETGSPRPAGYMTLGRAEDGRWILAPVPHGAVFHPHHPGAVVAPPGVTPPVAAVARFQQMAVLALDRLPLGTGLDGALVVGSGPVALGCVLELRRRGASRIDVLTGRRSPPAGQVPGVRCVRRAEPAGVRLVVDATGQASRAAALVAPGGVLGLLGTPDGDDALPAASLHRGGVTVLGMHELAGVNPAGRQDAYTTAATWLTGQLIPDRKAAWCRTVPGAHASRLLTSLRQNPGRRPAEPVVLFDWGGGTVTGASPARLGLYSISVRGLEVPGLLRWCEAGGIPFVHLRGGPRGFDLATRDPGTLRSWRTTARRTVPVTGVTADTDLADLLAADPSARRRARADLDQLSAAAATLGAGWVRLLARARPPSLPLPSHAVGALRPGALPLLVELHHPAWLRPPAADVLDELTGTHGLLLLADTAQLAVDDPRARHIAAMAVDRAAVAHLSDTGTGLDTHRRLPAARRVARRIAAGHPMEVALEWTGTDRTPAACLLRYRTAAAWWSRILAETALPPGGPQEGST